MFGARGDHDSPVLQELDAIFSRENPRDIILIDDIRSLRGNRVRQGQMLDTLGSKPQVTPYPELRSVLEYICEKRPTWIVDIAGDILRLHAPDLLVGLGQIRPL